MLGTIYSNTFEDCKKLSAMFDHTFTTHQTGVYSKPYESGGYEIVTCNNPGMCPDGTAKATCTW